MHGAWCMVHVELLHCEEERASTAVRFLFEHYSCEPADGVQLNVIEMTLKIFD